MSATSDEVLCVDCREESAGYDAKRCRECAQYKLARRVTVESIEAFTLSMEQQRRGQR